MQRRGRTAGGGSGLPLTQQDVGATKNGGTTDARRRKGGKSASCGRRLCQLIVVVVIMGGAYCIGVLAYAGHVEKKPITWKTIKDSAAHHPEMVKKTAERVLAHPLVKHTTERVISHAKRLYNKSPDSKKKNVVKSKRLNHKSEMMKKVKIKGEEKKRVLEGVGAGGRGGGGGAAGEEEEKKKNTMPYAHYGTLKYPFQHSKLVGLYFAASWCPDSTKPSNQLDEFFGAKLLPPPTLEQIALDENNVSSHHRHELASLSIVYVSSDDTGEQLLEYQKPNWIVVPFDSDERTGLKKEFSVCAKKEMEFLHMAERKHEIPTLILMDGESRTIVSTNGVEDLNEYGANALDHWLGLVDLVRSMEEKNTN